MPDNNLSTGSNNQPDNHISFFTPKVLWVIIGVLLLVVLATGIAWWQEIKETDQALQQAAENTQETNVPADWKTYTNDSLNFSIQYPPDWKIAEKNANGYPEVLVGPPDAPVEGTGFRLTIAFMDWRQFGDNFGEATVVGKKTTSIAGLETYTFTKDSVYGNDEQIYYSNLTNRYLVFRTAIDHEQMKQILSTFKFTDSSVTSDWKTHTNTQYGFEFKYPSDVTVKEINSSTLTFNKGTNVIISLIVSTPPGGAEVPITSTATINGQKYNISKTQTEYLYDLLNNNSVYTFETKEINISLLELILSTFKFTNSPDNQSEEITMISTGYAYKNNEYGFSLSFPGVWEGLSSKTQADSGLSGVYHIYFQVPITGGCTGDCKTAPLAITVYPLSRWTQIRNDTGVGTYIAQNSQYVFTYQPWQEPPNSTMMNFDFKFNQVISTFKFTN